jgi:UDPglucose 6-dehydrogenase/GDP-mannose 6-dehydrogenase
MRIAVVGTGYVGLVSGVCLAHLGHQVICVDNMAERVEAVNGGVPPFHEPGLSELLSAGLGEGRLRATTNLAAAVAASEVILIAVGTPSAGGRIDLGAVEAAAREIGQGLRESPEYKVVTVKSTVVPGTTDTLVRGLLEQAAGKPAGAFGLCMNPEFLREGAAVRDFLEPDRIVIGQWDAASGTQLARIYESFDCPKIFTGLRNAEFTKYASNALLATLISFSNEMAGLCEATPGTDIAEVLAALELDRRWSPVVGGVRVHPEILAYLRAGCGFGGSCLPKDVAALCGFARERGARARLLETVLEVNALRPAAMVAQIEQALGGLQDCRIAILGVSFKPGTDDLRESPAVAIMRLLAGAGAEIRAYDPVVQSLDGVVPAILTHSLEAALSGADAAVAITPWPEIVAADWGALAPRMRRRVIVDARNALDAAALPAGIRYVGIGRGPGPRREDELGKPESAGD